MSAINNNDVRRTEGIDGVAERDPSVGETPRDFIRDIVTADIGQNTFGGKVHTRFPPEPNGYLHIGHAKAICLNFGIAEEFGGLCNLRFDDTNPGREDPEFVDSMIRDIKWLGFDWGDRLKFASDYYEQLYDYAIHLIEQSLAYVCDLSAEEIRNYRGTLTEPGKPSPFRERSVEENLDLFRRMRDGEFPDGARVLRAKIDMNSGNLNMRDPVLYRILHMSHHRTGDSWCIYPTYDFAHGQSDSIEGITHSLCDLGFEDHRPLYDWILDKLEIHHPRQIEFARLNISYTILSKRRLNKMVQLGHVSGWDDPRMPSLSGMRRRGFTPATIRAFCDRIGLAKRESVVDVALLEHMQRDELNKQAPRVMAVLRPLRVVLENYPRDTVEVMEAENNPEDPTAGMRKLPFSRVLYIERDDFREDPPKKFFRLAPGREVRLKHAYFITCTDVIRNEETGEVEEVRCTYDPESRGGSTPDGRRVRGTLHWVSAAHSEDATVRLYEHLFTEANPLIGGGDDYLNHINPDSMKVLSGCKVEPGLANALPGKSFQFLRNGYFCVDSQDSIPGKPVFNRTMALRDSWKKIDPQRR